MKTLMDWLIGWPERVAQHLGALATVFARTVVTQARVLDLKRGKIDRFSM
ncbi:MAG: hypothetical protein ACLQKH_18550 [Steroidobacteraceae bacterium]